MGAGDSNVTIKTCVFDAGGNLINIGDWDERVQSVQVGVDDDGEPIYEQRPTNPLPEGAVIEEREVVYDDKYGWRLADQPVPKSKEELLQEQINDLTLTLGDFILSGGA